MTKQHARKRNKKNAKLTGGVKLAIAAAATTAMIGGWSAVGHLEAASSQTSALAIGPTAALIVPTSLPTTGSGAGPSAASIVLPAIPPLTIDPIPTLALALGSGGVANAGAGVATGGVIAPAAVSAPAIPTMAPLPALPALAPLPNLPSMPAPPPPPPARSGGGKKSSGS